MRSTLALDPTRSMPSDTVRAFWHADEIQLVSSSLSTSEVPVPRVVRWNAVTGTLAGVEQTYPAMMTALGTNSGRPRRVRFHEHTRVHSREC